MKGGHDVPISKIIDRYTRSVGNLALAIAIADRVYIYDNSVTDADATLCARTSDGMLRKVSGVLPAWIGDAVDALEHHPELIDRRGGG